MLGLNDRLHRKRDKLVQFCHDNLKKIPLRNPNEASDYPFKLWEVHLALFLKQPESEIEFFLRRLNFAYEYKNVKSCLETINKMPEFPGYPFLESKNFADHINYVCHFLGQTMTRTLPRVPVIAFSKSASSYVSVVLCRLFDVLPTVISFHHQMGVPAWVNAYKRFGGVLHEHYSPQKANLVMLNNAGINKIILHNRNPGEAIISLAFHWVNLTYNKDGKLDESTRIDLVRKHLDANMHTMLHSHANWTNSWLNEAKSGRIEILQTSYDELKHEPETFFKRILDYTEVEYNEASLLTILQELGQKSESGYNYRKAEKSEWRDILTASQMQKMQQIIRHKFNNATN